VRKVELLSQDVVAAILVSTILGRYGIFMGQLVKMEEEYFRFLDVAQGDP
jgi:hypothetical protein